MASEKPAAPPRELPEQQDHSIKARKHQLFEERGPDGPVVRPFAEYVRDTPPAPLPPVLKAGLWAVGVLVVLLLVAAIFGGRKAKGRRAELEMSGPGVESVGRVIPGARPGWRRRVAASGLEAMGVDG